jgi:hypothetical protein
MGAGETDTLLQQIFQQNAMILERLANLPTREDLQEVKAEVKEHDKFINGNGTPGAKTRLALVEEKVNDLLKRFDKIASDVAKDALAKMIQYVGVPLLLAAVAWAAKTLMEK